MPLRRLGQVVGRSFSRSSMRGRARAEWEQGGTGLLGLSCLRRFVLAHSSNHLMVRVCYSFQIPKLSADTCLRICVRACFYLSCWSPTS